MADVREKIARAIEKTSESIRKKHSALKTDRIEEDIALNKRFKPLIEPLRLFVDSPDVRATKRESRDEDAASAHKRERKEEEEQEEREEASETFERSMTLHKSNDRSHDDVQPIISTPRAKIVPTIESLENVFETTEDSLATKVQNQQTSEDREALRAGLGPLGQKYVEAVLRGARDKESGIDRVYGVYLHKDGLMFGNKRFDVDDADNIIIDGVRYAGTPGLYELIFKRIPDGCPLHGRRYALVQEHAVGDERAQTQVPFTGSIIEQQRIQVQTRNRVVDIGHTQETEEIWKGITSRNDIEQQRDYVHWDDPNELVDRL
ncbi:hypothetical protein ALC56_00618 [Trachymyrmex septentrionalis]|uniref:DUF8207 domain-containing protein n=1 Tax=Trachymyrmex septentrionalis TaxID=34720 RepID=A0A195FX12_9HYME|nr:hypothetical protein ALC56_00618 [Trachymyrmex septentrionalis]